MEWRFVGVASDVCFKITYPHSKGDLKLLINLRERSFSEYCENILEEFTVSLYF